MKQSLQDNKNAIIALLDEAYACRANNLKRSTELAKTALDQSRKLNDIELQAQSLSRLALFSMIKGEHEQSLQMSKEAIAYFEGLNNELGVADAKYNIAGVYYKTDNYHMGLVNLLDCIAIYRKHNDFHNLARSHKSLGTVYDYFGDEKNAIKTYEDAINASKLAGDLNLESNAYNPLSSIYIKQGKIDKAYELVTRSIEIKTQTNDIRGLAFGLYGRGKVYLAQKRYKEAEKDLTECIKIHLEMGEVLGPGMAWHRLAYLYVEMGRLEEAKEVLNKCLKYSLEYHLTMVTFKCYYLFYHIYKLENDEVKALKYLELYLKEKETVINTQTFKIIENYEMISRMESLKKEAEVQLEKAEIIEKKNHAEQAALVKQEFLSTMSHEIRTPLNAVITIATLLNDRPNKEEQELLNALRFASNNLLLLINDILDFTKLDAGKAHLEMRPANITQLLESIQSTYESLAREKGISLNLKINEDVVESYELDEIKLSQILGNLITNAIKFTPTGGVDILVEKTGGDELEDRLLFKVKDTGIGIPEEELENIFESFTQPKSITTRKQGGSGLGLAIVKKLVLLHDSSVAVNSVIDKGSTFSFELILKKSRTPNKSRTQYADTLNGKTVLLAEDNLINAMVIRKLLTNWKITSEHAKNGLEAVEMAGQKTFDFILMDIHMPEMDGFEATRHILSIENPNSGTPIFALTADVTAEYNKDYTGYFTGFLRKPIELDKLHEALVSNLPEYNKDKVV